MSNSTDAGRFSSFRPARAPEKSSTFAQTCSMLSQYLKEKKTNFGDLSLGMNTNSDGNGMKMMMPDTIRQTAATTTTTTMDLFPQESGFSPKSAEKQPETAQMTIFYNGQVIVLNDFPAEKAKQVMMLASNESASTFSSSLPPPPPPAVQKQQPIETCTNRITTSSGVAVVSSNTANNNNKIQECIIVPRPKPQSPVTAAAIPIARKASLTRFLEKRKDRITTRAPYPVSSNCSAKASPQKPAEAKPWLGLGAQYPTVQFRHQL